MKRKHIHQTHARNAWLAGILIAACAMGCSSSQGDGSSGSTGSGASAGNNGSGGAGASGSSAAGACVPGGTCACVNKTGCLEVTNDTSGFIASQCGKMDPSEQLEAACPTAGLVGCCKNDSKTTSTTYTCFYESSGMEAASVKAVCGSQSSEFVATPQ